MRQLIRGQGRTISSPGPLICFAAGLDRSGRLWRGCLDLAIDREGLIGHIQARAAPRQTLPPGVFEIGLVLYRQQDRGKRYGSGSRPTADRMAIRVGQG